MQLTKEQRGVHEIKKVISVAKLQVTTTQKASYHVLILIQGMVHHLQHLLTINLLRPELILIYRVF